MTLLDLELDGLPPSVNEIWRISGRRNFKPAKVREYQEYATAQMIRAWGKKPRYKERVALNLVFTTNDKRRWDIDNRVKALQDCLITAGVIDDDSQIDFLSVLRNYGNKKSTKLVLEKFDNLGGQNEFC